MVATQHARSGPGYRTLRNCRHAVATIRFKGGPALRVLAPPFFGRLAHNPRERRPSPATDSLQNYLPGTLFEPFAAVVA